VSACGKQQRVLFIDPFAEKGGAETVLVTIFKYLDRARFLPIVVFLSPGPLAATCRQLGVRTYVLPRHRRRNLLALMRAIAILCWMARRERVALVVSNGIGPHLYGGVLSALTRRPSVWYLFDPLLASSLGQRLINVLYLAIPASMYIFGADSTRESVVKRRPNVPSRLVYPASELMCEPTLLTAEMVRQRFEVSLDAPLMLVVARLQPSKGHAVLLEAMPTILARVPDVRLLIVGDALFGRHRAYAAGLRTQVDRLNLTSSVSFTGFCDDDTLRALLHTCNMLVHPAFEEPFGLVLTEAMFAGKPVLATTISGPRDIVIDGVTGRLIPPGDVKSMAEAAIEMLSNPVQVAQMGARGRARAEALFQPATMVRTLEEAYSDVLHTGNSVELVGLGRCR
jgi:glycosyltransferase involved in cell wall biosynthesis